jgi:hypothetical protein
MTLPPLVRSRLLGSLVVALAFVAGVATGIAFERRPRQGLNVTLTATTTNQMPRELERLGLSATQQGEIRTILTRGRDRVLTVVHDFDPRMRAAMDSTNAEIDSVLTAAQRASLAAYRRDHPTFRDEKIIKAKD